MIKLGSNFNDMSTSGPREILAVQHYGFTGTPHALPLLNHNAVDQIALANVARRHKLSHCVGTTVGKLRFDHDRFRHPHRGDRVVGHNDRSRHPGQIGIVLHQSRIPHGGTQVDAA